MAWWLKDKSYGEANDDKRNDMIKMKLKTNISNKNNNHTI